MKHVLYRRKHIDWCNANRAGIVEYIDSTHTRQVSEVIRYVEYFMCCVFVCLFVCLIVHEYFRILLTGGCNLNVNPQIQRVML